MPPAIYAATVIRVGVGVGIILFGAAPASRFPRVLRVLGILVLIGGLLTPFVGAWGSKAIIDSWIEGGSALVRIWAAFALALGGFIVYATAPGRGRSKTQ